MDRINKMSLISAVRHRDLERVKLMIGKGANVNYREETYGTTALFFAADGGDIDMCRLLIEKGADVNHKNTHGNTPLMYASFSSQIEIIQLLLSRGANVNHKNDINQTALDYASDNYIGNHISRMLYWRGAKCGDTINIESVLLLIYRGVIPRDLVREIHTKWIS
jgi:ankyrin repeat protein